MTTPRIDLSNIEAILRNRNEQIDNIVGASQRKPMSVFIGNPSDQSVFTDDTRQRVYVHSGGNEPSSLYEIPRSNIADSLLTFKKPVLIQEQANGDFVFLRADTQADQLYQTTQIEQKALTPVLLPQIRFGTIQPVGNVLQVLVVGAFYAGSYVRDIVTPAFDGTAQDTSSTAIQPPAANNRTLAVLIQVDATNGVLEYKQGTAYSSNISNIKAIENGNVPTKDADRFLVGYVFLRSGATAITPADIVNAPEWITSGGTGALGYPNPISEATTLETNRTLIVADELTLASGGSFTLSTGAIVKLISTRPARFKTVRTLTADTTLQSTDERVYVDASAGAVTITLPSASANSGLEFNVKVTNRDNLVTITSASNIEDSTSDITPSLYESLTFSSDGSGWWIV